MDNGVGTCLRQLTFAEGENIGSVHVDVEVSLHLPA